MDGEIKSFIKVWFIAVASFCYCYFIAGRIPKGLIRLLSLLPIFYIFLILPLSLSSTHLCAPTAFYLSWLANFKLILFAFDLGPLSSQPPIPLLHFISIACLPIKIKENPSPQSTPITQTPQKITKNNANPSKTKSQLPPTTQTLQEITKNSANPSHPKTQSPSITDPYYSQIASEVPTPLVLALKVLLLATIVRIYDYRQHLHLYFVLLLYCFHVYLGVEIVLALSAAPARRVLGIEFEPQFNEPYLATSLQDFWGRRWNLMVPNILRPTVYRPTRHLCAPVVGTLWASVPAIVASFCVSGIMHELIYYYCTRVDPTWEVTWFFILHGVCTAAEVVAKRAVRGRWQLHRAVSGPLTVGFVAITGGWLFFPQLRRNGVDERTIREYSILVEYVKQNWPLHLHWE